VRDDRLQENFLYSYIYDVLRAQEPIRDKTLKLQQLNAKITRIQSKRVQVLQTDMEDSTRIYGEPPSIYHLIQTRSRRQRRLIMVIIDTHGTFRNTHNDIMKAFVQFFYKGI
jgi:hypothetical protein